MTPTLVINVVGLSKELLGRHTPHLTLLAADSLVAPIAAVTPAVTCSAQAAYLTGKLPNDNGIVGNGWYFRDLAEVLFWRQSNHLVEGQRLWDVARSRDSKFTVANLFWWYNMYSSADYSVTPRPMYPADGRKIPDVYTHPPELRTELTTKFRQFPLFKFWGPAAGIESSRWITSAALHVMRVYNPTLALVYLPHLDYSLQRLGPALDNPLLQRDLRAVDSLCGELIDYAKVQGRRIIVLSEYGITNVDGSIHPNRVLRQAGFVAVREELGRELLDPGASEAFSVADHQVAHVYVKNAARVPEVKRLFEAVPGIAQVLDAEAKKALHLDHPRSGELVLISDANKWFSYYYWLDETKAPDFASTVDIHRKPGYDPVELFFDPKVRMPKLAAAFLLLKRKLGFRTLMNLISTRDTQLVKGSHGRVTDDPTQGPILLCPPVCSPPLDEHGLAPATAVFDAILNAVFK
jgi:predicted AlkP superfamily pyrophosphatase or phosphodiesterase